MLDLEKLERMLDEALATETRDSLNSWLDSQRQSALSDFLGPGTMGYSGDSVMFSQCVSLMSDVTHVYSAEGECSNMSNAA
jgi:hypothetical protein